jgi:hypothetical protein
VILSAGKSDQKFIVHKKFACYYSPVLKAAFNSNFIEGQIYKKSNMIFANARLVKVLPCSAPSNATIHVKVSIPIISEAELRKHQAE